MNYQTYSSQQDRLHNQTSTKQRYEAFIMQTLLFSAYLTWGQLNKTFTLVVSWTVSLTRQHEN